MTTLNNHYNIMPSRVPRRVFALRAIAHYEGKLKFISFQSYEKQYQHWLSLILKANQICWFPWLWKSIPTLAFAHCETNPNSTVSASPEINPTLAFAHCESNPISMVSVSLETIPTLAFAHCKSKSNSF
jgi:hypothetical protein